MYTKLQKSQLKLLHRIKSLRLRMDADRRALGNAYGRLPEVGISVDALDQIDAEGLETCDNLDGLIRDIEDDFKIILK